MTLLFRLRIELVRREKGFRYLLEGLNPERILIAAEAVGFGKGNGVNRAARYARERVVFGRPIGQNQAIQHPLAKSWAELEAGWFLGPKTRHRLMTGGKPRGPRRPMRQNFFCSEPAFPGCERAVMTHGGRGLSQREIPGGAFCFEKC
ncbi:MAG: hypothetical protein CM1200mP41_30740 [Gammaproteobacteria bacterium]|nr:MAG: hypothetical protein CM1200mP41_30740 [Gammaproteobacteria bacterium]